VYECWLPMSWPWLRVMGNRTCSTQSWKEIELEKGWTVRGLKVSSGEPCLCFAAAISWVVLIAAGEAPHKP